MLTAGALSSCKKDKEPVVEESKNYYKLERVENLAPAVTGTKNMYFNLETKNEVTAEQVKSTNWDLAFGGFSVSYMSGNNGTDPVNYGIGGGGKGGILVIEKPFDQVIDVPADADFKTGVNLFGMDKEGDRATETGWYLYDEKGTIKGDGSPRKQHVVYAMSDSRTVVVRTANGDYAKIKMISCYKDAFTADQWFIDSARMFYTFEYVVVPKGSTKFQIK